MSSPNIPKQLLKLRGRHSGVWFRAEYHPRKGPSEKLDEKLFGDFPGLLFFHFLDTKTPDTRHWVSYWSSRAEYEASRVPLETLLAVDQLSASGYVREPTVERQKFWQKVTAYSLLLHVVAFLGALASLEKHHARLLEPANVRLEFPESKEGWLNVLEGSAIETEFRLSNLSPTQTAIVTLESAVVAPVDESDSWGLELPEDPFPVSEDKSETLPLRGRELDSGEYRLKIRGLASSGKWRRPRNLKGAIDLGVRVWPRGWEVTEIGIRDPAPESDPGSVQKLMALNIATGSPSKTGLECGVYLQFDPGVRLGKITAPGLSFVSNPVDYPADVPEMTFVEWKTGPRPVFVDDMVLIELTGRPADSWEEFVGSAQARCSSPFEEDS